MCDVGDQTQFLCTWDKHFVTELHPYIPSLGGSSFDQSKPWNSLSEA